MITANLSLFILPLILILAHSTSQSEDPKWPNTCLFQRYPGKRVYAKYYKDTYGVSTVDACEKQCQDDAKCGSYNWFSSTEECHRYHISVDMAKAAGFNGGTLFSSSLASSGSRNCKANTEKSNCNYKYTQGKVATFGRMIYVKSSKIVTAKMCQDLCSLYPKCKSIALSRSGPWCYLSSTSLREGENICSINSRDCGSYEKTKCGTTTTANECPKDYNEHDLYLICDPTEAKECEAEGCCWFTEGSDSYCLKPEVAA